jgi:hypothetical protein
MGPSDLARADGERAAFYRVTVEFFATYDLLVTPGALTPAFDVNLRNAPTIGGQKLDNYLGGSTVTAVITSRPVPPWPFGAVSINSAGRWACNSLASRVARPRFSRLRHCSKSCSV